MSTKERVDKALRSTWLAGLGVYQTSLDSLGEQIDKNYEKGVSLWDECLQRGVTINDELMKPVNQFEARVSDLRAKLGLEKPSVDEQLDKLEAQLVVLADKVAVLAEQKVAKPVAAPAKKVEEKEEVKAAPKRRTTKAAATTQATKRTTTKRATPAKAAAKPAAPKTRKAEPKSEEG